MSRVRTFFIAISLAFSFTAIADEGMWIPLLLERMNEKEMKSLGMKISAKDIYNINKGSLKDAIVSFGGFCTGEVISSKGLVLTNHHCGFDAIQNHSTLDRNYIRDGFWAKNYGEELSNPGLFVTFIVRIEDVTKQVLNGATPALEENQRQSIVDRNISELRRNLKKESYQDAFIRGFFESNQYYLFVTETYKDVRLVGAPPSSIGNFGKDTDNWIWPRHTGDFSMFRIYAGKDNKPADYSPDNVPFTPKRSLSISLDGAAEGDFTMVFGFPGRTTEYLPAVAVQQIMEVNDPAKIAIRDKVLAVMDGYMRKDEQIKIQYAEKYALVSNAWKKWQGEVLGLTRTNAVEKKKVYEAEFQKRVDANPQWRNQYGSLLRDLGAAYNEFRSFGLARDYYLEITSRIELFTIAGQLNTLRNSKNNGSKNAYSEGLAKTREKLSGIYKEYSPVVDRNLFEVLMNMYVNDQDSKIISPIVLEQLKAAKNDFRNWADQVYGGEELTAGNKVMTALEQNPAEFLERTKTDRACVLYNDIAATYNTMIASKLNEIQTRINKLQRTYMQAQMEVMKEKKFYPDANSTLRVTYGKVKGYSAKDAVKYDYYTYLDGVIEKYVPGDYEFDVPKKLRELYNNKDFGQYGKNGRLPVCFIASNHTTGGNSGSPALDAWGNLVGLNFDRSWEGTMSDINYDPSICRNIMVDIRYVLFIIDKYAEASWLVKEMKLVHAKKK